MSKNNKWGKGMKNLLTYVILSIILLSVGWGQCNPGEVELWGECYSIENTTMLDLSLNQLTGEIPPEFGNLTNLTMMDLAYNQLTGEIPPEIGNLTNLTWLGLSNNQLTGEIPPEIGNLTNLRSLHLNNNQLTGEIPPEIGNLTNLTLLGLSNNQLTGEIPPEIGNLTNLTILFLHINQLTGEIPPEIGNLTNLTELWLQDNYLYCENGEQNTDLIPQTIIDYCGQFLNEGGLYEQNCSTVEIDESNIIPFTYNLSNPYPNPFNPNTTIEFSVPNSELVTVKVYDIVGNEINTIINNELLSGNYTIIWNGSNQSNGVYFIRMESGRFMDTKKVILLK